MECPFNENVEMTLFSVILPTAMRRSAPEMPDLPSIRLDPVLSSYRKVSVPMGGDASSYIRLWKERESNIDKF